MGRHADDPLIEEPPGVVDAAVEVAARTGEVRTAERAGAVDEQAVDARTDWLERIGRRRTAESVRELKALPAPNAVRAESGSGHVTLRWDPVPGAIGYLVHRAASADGPYLPLDHGGGDVLAVPGATYADTTIPSRPDRLVFHRQPADDRVARECPLRCGVLGVRPPAPDRSPSWSMRGALARDSSACGAR